jgi:hypothetical protein
VCSRLLKAIEQSPLFMGGRAGRPAPCIIEEWHKVPAAKQDEGETEPAPKPPSL